MLDQFLSLVALVTRLFESRNKRLERESLIPNFSCEKRVITGGNSRTPSEWTKMHEEGFLILRIHVASAPADWVLQYVDAGSTAQIDEVMTNQSGYWVGGKRTNKVAYGKRSCHYLIRKDSHDCFDILAKPSVENGTIRLRLEGADGTLRELTIPRTQTKWMEHH